MDVSKNKSNTSSDSLILVHSTLGSLTVAGLVPEAGLVHDSKVSFSTERQFNQLSDSAKSFESQTLFSKVIIIFF